MGLKLTLLVACLATGTAGPLAAEAVDVSRCRNVQPDKQRLGCYDDLGKSQLPKGEKPHVDLIDLKLDWKQLKGKTIVTTGSISMFSGSLFLKAKATDMNTVTVKYDGLPRDQIKSLMEDCGGWNNCDAEVTAKVTQGFGGLELQAIDIQLSDEAAR